MRERTAVETAIGQRVDDLVHGQARLQHHIDDGIVQRRLRVVLHGVGNCFDGVFGSLVHFKRIGHLPDLALCHSDGRIVAADHVPEGNPAQFGRGVHSAGWRCGDNGSG